jgi:DNA-directed RNA polymerase alpha subunit
MRLFNILEREQIETFDDLASMSAGQFRALKNVGLGTLVEAQDILAEHGMSFRGDESHLAAWRRSVGRFRNDAAS